MQIAGYEGPVLMIPGVVIKEQLSIIIEML